MARDGQKDVQLDVTSVSVSMSLWLNRFGRRLPSQVSLGLLGPSVVEARSTLTYHCWQRRLLSVCMWPVRCHCPCATCALVAR